MMSLLLALAEERLRLGHGRCCLLFSEIWGTIELAFLLGSHLWDPKFNLSYHRSRRASSTQSGLFKLLLQIINQKIQQRDTGLS